MEKLPITFVMVIHNEENRLTRALDSFCDVASEIIILHDGECSDKSLEIAARYTDKIFILPHTGSAELHRVVSYEKAQNDWVFQVDADEFLSIELKEKLPELIAATDVDIYTIAWPIYHLSRYYYFLYKPCLFRKSRVYYIAAPQEYARLKYQDGKIVKIEEPLWHQPPQTNRWKDQAKKINTRTIRDATGLTSNFQELVKWNCDLTDWPFSNKIRIDHPIIAGMFGSALLQTYVLGKWFLLKKDSFYILEYLYGLRYIFKVYWLVLVLKFKKSYAQKN